MFSAAAEERLTLLKLVLQSLNLSNQFSPLFLLDNSQPIKQQLILDKECLLIFEKFLILRTKASKTTIPIILNGESNDNQNLLLFFSRKKKAH